MSSAALVLYIDGGTTQTRVWAVRADEVVGSAKMMVGARDTARDGSPAKLRAGVRQLLAEAAAGETPAAIVAAGMITSPQGLCEVPHAEAPAGVDELAAGAVRLTLPGVAELPILFIPGVRSGPLACDRQSIPQADIMRGEEVLALGLYALGHLPSGGTLLNLGSHWKAIQVDAVGRITGSVSTLSGELIHAVQTQTILASALPAERPPALEPGWVAAGARAAEKAGLARALYCVRLLEQRAPSQPAQRYAFLVGAAIASDLPALVPSDARTVLLVGAPVVAQPWADLLRAAGRDVSLIDEEVTLQAFRAGCRAVLRHLNPELAT